MYLLALALLVLLAVDFIAVGLRRPTWSGLPILVALTVPISVLDAPLAGYVFVTTALLFVMLLASVENEQTLSWGQAVTGRRQRSDGSDQILDRASAQGPALKVGSLAVLGALVLPVFVPLGHDLGLGSGNNSGGRGAGQPVQLKNPMADLRRDLVRQDHLPLLTVRTDATDPSYLRTTVLETFDGRAWVPGHRNLPAANIANGPLPAPPGLLSSAGSTATWHLKTTTDFLTTWLPAPYPLRDITVDQGDWRFDNRTMDVTNVDKTAPVPVSYSLRSYTPDLSGGLLDGAAPPPVNIVSSMTAVPGLTPTVRRIARQLTATGNTDYAKVLLLQNWFRKNGGFRYSLTPAAGDGMAQLERFITSDKVGYCEQFAAAMAVMARAIGIPARVVVGFLEPTTKTGPDEYTYTTDDEHAWPEVYFSGSGWVRFEPTPSTRTGSAPAWARGTIAAPDPTTPTASPSTSTTAPGPKKEPVDTTSSSGSGGSTATSVLRLALVLLLLVALAVPAVLRRAQRRRRLGRRTDPRLELENLWRELRATAIDVRIPWPEGRSPRTAARILGLRVSASADENAALADLVGTLEEARYRERFELDEETRASCRAATATWIRVITQAAPPRRSRLARFLPRSVLDSRRQLDQDSSATVRPEANSYTEVG
jgi:transglutaminase-like putative cysteine protease